MNGVVVDNEKLIGTSEASRLSGYSKDYIGQLCREEKIECRRISGHWYVSAGSIREYQQQGVQPVGSSHAMEDIVGKDESDTDERPKFALKTGNVRDDTFCYDGIEFVSTARASELTGYAQDYIGQLARNGGVRARKVGRRWFIGRKSLIEHKKHNDALLASVQAQASGITKNYTEASQVSEREVSPETTSPTAEVSDSTPTIGSVDFNVRYVSETTEKPLVPQLGSEQVVSTSYIPGDISTDKPIITKLPIAPTPAQTLKTRRYVGSEIRTVATEKPDGPSPISAQRTASTQSAPPSVYVPPTTHTKKRFSLRLVVLIPIVAIFSLASAYGYFFGLTLPSSEIFSSFVNADDFSMLVERIAERVPGRELTYTQE